MVRMGWNQRPDQCLHIDMNKEDSNDMNRLLSHLRKITYKALSLKQALCIIVVCNSLALLLCTLLGLGVYNDAYEQLLSNSMERSLSITSAQISQTMENVEYISSLIISSTSVQDTLSNLADENNHVNTSRYNRTLRNALLEYSTLLGNSQIAYAAIYSGIGTSSTDWTLLEQTPSFQLSTAITSAEARTGAVAWTSINQGKYLLLSRNIREVNYLSLRSIGNLVIAVDMESLVQNAMQFLSTYPDQKCILATPSGTILYATDGLDDAAVQDLLEPFDRSYQIVSLQSHKYFAIQGTLPHYNYRFLSLAPYDNVADALSLTLRLLAFILICGLVTMTYLSNRLISAIIRQFDLLIARMESFTQNELALPEEDEREVRYQPREIRALHRKFNEMALRIRELVKVNYESKLLTKEAQLQSLRAQISPHFLYNTLETINWRAKAVGNNQISQIAESLGSLLRASLSNQRPLVELSYELELVESFMTIQRIRFEEQLSYKADIGADAVCGLIPPLTIQPLVENAIHYGMEEMTEVCHIELVAQVQNELLEICVRNEGSRFEDGLLDMLRSKERQPHGFGIGLLNIDKRIRLIFGDAYGLELTNDGAFAVAILRLPYTTDMASVEIGAATES